MTSVGVRAQGMGRRVLSRWRTMPLRRGGTPQAWPHGLSFVGLHSRDRIKTDDCARCRRFPSLGVSYYHRNISQIQPSELYRSQEALADKISEL